MRKRQFQTPQDLKNIFMRQLCDNVQAVDHDSVKKPVSAQTGEPKGGERKDGQVYLPGFGWVTETGGSGTTVDGDGDINKQVGTMD
ncbi:hypothetical protein Pmgp_02505 [Pelotomaculum propionicicum]|uniref:Uncharacterized protein n=1 Tax=Pelotomaculum propionicicum TaxID=258475 RepID=A0A4Y7RMK3_9FIRM|nr:hypothetical protein Pmgp_02505 [Pelotomaculum propionicicum]